MKICLQKSTEGAPLYEQKGAVKRAESVEARFMTMLVLGIPYAGAVSAFVAVTALVPILAHGSAAKHSASRDAVQRSRLCCAVQSLFRVHEERTHLLRRGLFNIQDDNLLRECRI